jgi:hypothetical protein
MQKVIKRRVGLTLTVKNPYRKWWEFWKLNWIEVKYWNKPIRFYGEVKNG